MKKLEEQNLCDDLLFFNVMQDEKLCKELLELIFQKPIAKIVHQSEKPVKNKSESKGIRLDVYLEGDGKLYVVEMQQGKQRYLPQRSRYYQGVLDVDYVNPGESVGKLKESYIIFICTFPVFDGKRHVYTFRNLCVEDTSIQMGDGTNHIFISTKGTMDDISPEMAEFLRFVEDSFMDDEDMVYDFTKHLKAKVDEVKTKGVQEAKDMTYETRLQEKWEDGWEEGLEKGIEQGRDEGREEGREEGIKIFIQSCVRRGYSENEICDELNEYYSLTQDKAMEHLRKVKNIKQD